MRAAVVHDGRSGSAREVALAVAAGLSAHVQVDVLETPAAAPAPGTELLVLGGPSLTRPLVAWAAADVPEGPSPTDVCTWAEQAADLPPRAATFDVRERRDRWFPGTARAAARRLDRRGVAVVARPRSYLVDELADGLDGGLVGGAAGVPPEELARAREWGEQLGAVAAARVALGLV